MKGILLTHPDHSDLLFLLPNEAFDEAPERDEFLIISNIKDHEYKKHIVIKGNEVLEVKYAMTSCSISQNGALKEFHFLYMPSILNALGLPIGELVYKIKSDGSETLESANWCQRRGHDEFIRYTAHVMMARSIPE